jgi:hypothetical protein
VDAFFGLIQSKNQLGRSTFGSGILVQICRPCSRLRRRCPRLQAHELQSGVGAELETQNLLKTHGQVNEPASGSFFYVRLLIAYL